jgi:hypothetical protein
VTDQPPFANEVPPTRRFYLYRTEDWSGVSGVGVVATGVQFSDGNCALRWNSEFKSTAVYDDIETVENIHGHGGRTKVMFLDPPRYS